MGKKQRDPERTARKIESKKNKGKMNPAQFQKFLDTVREQGQTDEVMKYLEAMGKDMVINPQKKD